MDYFFFTFIFKEPVVGKKVRGWLFMHFFELISSSASTNLVSILMWSIFVSLLWCAFPSLNLLNERNLIPLINIFLSSNFLLNNLYWYSETFEEFSCNWGQSLLLQVTNVRDCPCDKNITSFCIRVPFDSYWKNNVLVTLKLIYKIVTGILNWCIEWNWI